MSIIAAGTTTTTALSSTGNTDGTLQLQVNGTTPSITLNTLGAIGVGSTPSYGTAGQVLTSGGSTTAPTWSSVAGGSQWTTSGSNIYYTTGSVLVGTTTNPVSSAGVFSHTGDGYGLTVGDIATYTNRTGIYLRGGNENRIGWDGGGYLTFVQASTERARINGYGLGLGGAVPSSGMGITFPATQSASSDANTLDDYEEGTWTPTLTYGSPGTLSVSYANRAGFYTKIGNMVYFSCFVQLSSYTKGTASGGLRITGIPFTAQAPGDNEIPVSFSTYNSPLPTTAGQFPFMVILDNSTVIALGYGQNNAAGTDWGDLNNNSQFKISGSYQV